MNKKLIFRILGALASALIIVAVFVPFISVTGYSTSLWQSSEVTKSLYLPIMIIAFGAIGVIFFALNIKTEFAYMSTGAIIFFLVMQTIDIINQGGFETISVGYYFLAIGSVLTGIMAFLTNLKVKEIEKVAPKYEIAQEENSMLNQIDRLYTTPNEAQNEMVSIQPIDNVVQPITVAPLAPIEPIPEVIPVVQNQPIPEMSAVSNPVSQVQQINPVVQEFSNPVNPVVQEFNQGNVGVQQQINMPQNNTIDQSNISQVSNVISPIQNIQPIENTSVDSISSNNSPISNPVVQEFETRSTNLSIPQQQFVTEPTPSTVVQNQPASTVETASIDIFGQPINK